MANEIGPMAHWAPEELALWKVLGFHLSCGGDAPREIIRSFAKGIQALRTRQQYGSAVRRLLAEIERIDSPPEDFDLSKKKLKDGKQLPSFSKMQHLAACGIDIHYVLLGERICDQKKLDQLANDKPRGLGDFERILMNYGGGSYAKVSEPQRIGFCNWLLQEFLEECPYRDGFIKHFSAGGDRENRKRIAYWLARDTYISMGDLADAVFQCTTDPNELKNYAGEDGCK